MSSLALNGLCVQLDTLLDTRMGTVMKMHGAEKVTEILLGGYHSRLDDNFPGVNVEAYKAAYAERDLETIGFSALTNIMGLLRELVAKLMKQAIKGPFHDGVRIVVNTHPYTDLSKEDTAEIIASVAYYLRDFTQLEIPIRFEAVNLTDAELTPAYCKSNFSTLLMYDVQPWLSAHQHALLVNPIPQVTFIAPTLYAVHTPTEAEFNELKAQLDWGETPFDFMEKAVRGSLHLKLVPAGLFSVVKPA